MLGVSFMEDFFTLLSQSQAPKATASKFSRHNRRKLLAIAKEPSIFRISVLNIHLLEIDMPQ